MLKVRLSYDGWLALPEAVRRKLGIGTGDQLEVELVKGAVILRPTSRTGAAVPPPAEPATAMPAEAATSGPAAVGSPAEPVRRGRGRPRKAANAVILPPGLEGRGRRTAVPPAE